MAQVGLGGTIAAFNMAWAGKVWLSPLESRGEAAAKGGYSDGAKYGGRFGGLRIFARGISRRRSGRYSTLATVA